MNGQDERMARRPFSSIPDIEAYYPSVSAETAHRRIFRTLDRGEGIALLFGDAGLGKTLALRLLTGKFELDAPVLLFSNARIANRRSFYLELLYQLRCDFNSSDEDELRVRFFEHLRGGVLALLAEDVPGAFFPQAQTQKGEGPPRSAFC